MTTTRKSVLPKTTWQAALLAVLITLAVIPISDLVRDLTTATAEMPADSSARDLLGLRGPVPTSPKAASAAEGVGMNDGTYLLAADGRPSTRTTPDPRAYSVGVTTGATWSPVARVFDTGAWRRASYPTMPTSGGFSGVAMLGSGTTIAVGSQDIHGTYEPLIASGHGRTLNTVTLAPMAESYLVGVDAASADDVYAVGGSPAGLFALHFDGQRWQTMPTPSADRGFFSGVSVIAENDVWAVGASYAGGGFQPLTAHFDGTSWTIVENAAPHAARSMLASVTALSDHNVYAVGYATVDGSAAAERPLVQHFDGESWSVVPNDVDERGALWSVTDMGPNNVWAGGTSDHGALIVPIRASSGDTDTRVGSPPTQSGEEIWGFAGLSRSFMCAVGGGSQQALTGSGTRGLMFHYNGTTWTDA